MKSILVVFMIIGLLILSQPTSALEIKITIEKDSYVKVTINKKDKKLIELPPQYIEPLIKEKVKEIKIVAKKDLFIEIIKIKKGGNITRAEVVVDEVLPHIVGIRRPYNEESIRVWSKENYF